MNRDQIDLIFDKLKRFLPDVWEGKESIQYMKDNGCHHWKQMEWPGFYFQFMCETILGDEEFMDIPGPRYGNVEFDGFRFIPWDFKAHSIDPARGDVGKIPTNGYQETMQAIREYGEVCFIIASGESEYDTDGSFKAWHDALKGGISRYEEERITRQAPSRRRKTKFNVDELIFVFVNEETIQHCGTFQANFRNSNGIARNAKVMIDVNNPNLEIYKFDFRD